MRKAVVAVRLAIASIVVVVSSCFSERQSATGPLLGDCKVPIGSGAAGSVVVFMRNFTFIPDQVTVKRGTKITWVNCEDAGTDAHTSTSDSGIWDSPSIQIGDTWSRTFNDATGTVLNYHCTPHPFMKATINVE